MSEKNLRITDHVNDRLICSWKGRNLFEYVYCSQVPEDESPAPYWHPLRTLRGEDATLFRPHDHSWHTGLSMTTAELNGQNFWGGNTYVHGEGYVPMKNNGRQKHVCWDEKEAGDGATRVVERLRWETRDNRHFFNETRSMEVLEIDENEGYWTLGLQFKLHNVSGDTLNWGSPTTKGRPNAGYGGLFWRGPRSFSGGRKGANRAFIADGSADDEIMGRPSPWLAYVGSHDGSVRHTTMLFIDHPENPRHPTKWFLRTTPFAASSASFMFDEVYPQEPDEVLDLRYRIVLVDDTWTADKIDSFVALQWK